MLWISERYKHILNVLHINYNGIHTDLESLESPECPLWTTKGLNLVVSSGWEIFRLRNVLHRGRPSLPVSFHMLPLGVTRGSVFQMTARGRSLSLVGYFNVLPP